jgi:hypothetical protein
METATARMIERKAFTVLKYSLLPARVRLPDGGANRRFEFDKRSQFFHLHAQRNAFRRGDVRLQSRLFARWNQALRRSLATRFAHLVHRSNLLFEPKRGILLSRAARLYETVYQMISPFEH